MTPSSPTADFEPMLSLLAQQLSQYQQVLTLVEQQRAAITDNDLETLNKLVRAESGQLRQLAALEKKRQQAGEHLRQALGLTTEAISLSGLIPYAAPTQQQELNRLLDEFTSLISQLKLANDTNNMLLQTNIELNEMMLGLFAENEDPLNNFYNEDGREQDEKLSAPSVFDQQI